MAAKKRLEPVSLASQSVLNPLNTGFALPSPARSVSIRLYGFDTFSTPCSAVQQLTQIANQFLILGYRTLDISYDAK